MTHRLPDVVQKVQVRSPAVSVTTSSTLLQASTSAWRAWWSSWCTCATGGSGESPVPFPNCLLRSVTWLLPACIHSLEVQPCPTGTVLGLFACWLGSLTDWSICYECFLCSWSQHWYRWIVHTTDWSCRWPSYLMNELSKACIGSQEVLLCPTGTVFRLYCLLTGLKLI